MAAQQQKAPKKASEHFQPPAAELLGKDWHGEWILCQPEPLAGMARFGVAQSALFLSLCVRSAVTLRFLQEEPSAVAALVPKTQGVRSSKKWDGGVHYELERFLVFTESVLAPKADRPIAGTRVERFDHLIVGEARAFWPPPLQSPERDGRASRCWEVVAPSAGDDDEWTVDGEALQALKNHVEGDLVVAFRLGTKKDRASKRWAVRVAWKEPVEGILGEHTDFEAPGGLKFEARLRCAFCSISPPWSTYHDHAQCPYMGTLNKVREHLHVEPAMVLADNRIRLARAEKPVELKAFLAEDKKWKAEIERKIGELTAALKGGKKRKSADDAPGPSKPTKTPKKEKKEKAQGKQEGGSKDVKGKGKAKD